MSAPTKGQAITVRVDAVTLARLREYVARWNERRPERPTTLAEIMRSILRDRAGELVAELRS